MYLYHVLVLTFMKTTHHMGGNGCQPSLNLPMEYPHYLPMYPHVRCCQHLRIIAKRDRMHQYICKQERILFWSWAMAAPIRLSAVLANVLSFISFSCNRKYTTLFL